MLVTLLTACGSESDEMTSNPKEKELSFAVKVDDGISSRAHSSSFYTRASIALENTYTKFLVKTIKTLPGDIKQKVMDNFEVDFDTEKHWYYDGVKDQTIKYWDENASKYTFAAVTPLPNNETDAPFPYKETKVTINDDGNISFNGVKGNISCGNVENSENAPEWMAARTVRTNTDLKDEDDLLATNKTQPFTQPNSFTSTVPLNFHHITAKVDFKAYSTNGLITLKKFKVSIPDAGDGEVQDLIINQGNYTTTSGWTDRTAVSNSNQDSRNFCDYTYLNGKVLGTASDNAMLLASNVQIPQDFPAAGRKFTITCEDSDGKKYTGTITLNATNNGSNSWLQDKHYTYLLKIAAEGATEVILFEVDMETWKWQEGNAMEETENDW